MRKRREKADRDSTVLGVNLVVAAVSSELDGIFGIEGRTMSC